MVTPVTSLNGRVFRRLRTCKPAKRETCRTCRSKKGGHLSKRYSIEYYIPGQRDEQGRPIKKQEATGLKDEGLALDLLRQRQQQLQGARVQVDASGVRFMDLVAEIRADYKDQDRNVKRLETSLKHLIPYFEHFAAVGVDVRGIAAYRMLRREEGAAKASVNRELTALRRMFKIAYKQGKILHEHIPHIELYKEHNIRQALITREQMSEMLRLMLPQQRRVSHVTYITGWRAFSDVLTREWAKHVDWKRGVLLILEGEGKAKTERKFPLFGELRRILEEQREYVTAEEKRLGQKIPWVFFSVRKGVDGVERVFRLKTYRRHWATVVKAVKAAHPDWNTTGWIRHTMRYSAVDNLLRMGVDAVDICAMVGMTMTTLRRYHKLPDARLELVGNRLQGFFGQPLQPTI